MGFFFLKVFIYRSYTFQIISYEKHISATQTKNIWRSEHTEWIKHWEVEPGIFILLQQFWAWWLHPVFYPKLWRDLLLLRHLRQGVSDQQVALSPMWYCLVRQSGRFLLFSLKVLQLLLQSERYTWTLQNWSELKKILSQTRWRHNHWAVSLTPTRYAILIINPYGFKWQYKIKLKLTQDYNK